MKHFSRTQLLLPFAHDNDFCFLQGPMAVGIATRKFIAALGGAAASWPLAARGTASRLHAAHRRARGLSYRPGHAANRARPCRQSDRMKLLADNSESVGASLFHPGSALNPRAASHWIDRCTQPNDTYDNAAFRCDTKTSKCSATTSASRCLYVPVRLFRTLQ